MVLSSVLLEKAVQEFAKLPGIGKKTALRLVLHLLQKDKDAVQAFSQAITTLRQDIRFCKRCHHLADDELCSVCANPSRQQQTICVVENIRDVIAIESTQQYQGMYHVLGGIISPLDGIGPDQLAIESLVDRVARDGITEVIFALNANIQGDTTIYYISKLLKAHPVRISTIARGIAFGGELEYADEMTLAKSISNRIPVDGMMQFGG